MNFDKDIPTKNFGPFNFASPEIIEVKICYRQILWHHIRVCVDFFFKLNFLPPYLLRSQGDKINMTNQTVGACERYLLIYFLLNFFYPPNWTWAFFWKVHLDKIKTQLNGMLQHAFCRVTAFTILQHFIATVTACLQAQCRRAAIRSITSNIRRLWKL